MPVSTALSAFSFQFRRSNDLLDQNEARRIAEAPKNSASGIVRRTINLLQQSEAKYHALYSQKNNGPIFYLSPHKNLLLFTPSPNHQQVLSSMKGQMKAKPFRLHSRFFSRQGYQSAQVHYLNQSLPKSLRCFRDRCSQ